MKSSIKSSAIGSRAHFIVALAFGLSLLGADSLARASGSESRSATVSLSGFNLSTPRGVREAREKVQQTARLLCAQLEDPTDLGHQQHFVACVEGAVANALRSVEGPAFVAAN
jgi:UrcA family protein